MERRDGQRRREKGKEKGMGLFEVEETPVSKDFDDREGNDFPFIEIFECRRFGKVSMAVAPTGSLGDKSRGQALS